MSRNIIRKTIIVVLVFVIGVVAGIGLGSSYFFPRFIGGIDSSTDTFDFSKIERIYEYVDRFHVNPELDPEQMEVNAIKGMLQKVDGGYTRYETAEEYELTNQMSISGEYAGIGVIVTMLDERVTVVSPYKGTPADKAGLGPGDVIIRVNGESIIGLPLNEVSNKIKGKIGTAVTLEILPDGKATSIEKEIIRENIEIPVTEHSIYDQVGHVRLTIFNNNSPAQLEKAVDEVVSQGAEALLLDLRGNPGGRLDKCIEIVDMFLDRNKVVLKEVDRNDKEVIHKTRQKKTYDIPMAILINKGSASASEIVTGALRDHQIATILGETTFGKGSVQKGWQLEDGGVLWITTDTYRTPSGENINKVGISPDIQIPAEDVKTDDWTKEQLEQHQLEKALEWVENNILK